MQRQSWILLFYYFLLPLTLLLLTLLPHTTAQAQFQFTPPSGVLPGQKWHYVFVSEDAYLVAASITVPPAPGKFGGIDAADWNMMFDAFNGAFVPGWNGIDVTWHAILSTNGDNARDRIPIEGPLFRTDDVKVADGFDDFWDGTLDAAISVNQFGNTITGSGKVWTGTNAFGNWAGESCSKWDDDASGNLGRIGNAYSASDAISSSARNCDLTARLYAVSPAYVAPGAPGGGDFNGNGIVDAADYPVWLDHLGGDESGILFAGDGDGVVDQDDYDLWKAAFGNLVGTAAATVTGSEAVSTESVVATLPNVHAATGHATTQVPEPSGFWLVASVFLGIGFRTRV